MWRDLDVAQLEITRRHVKMGKIVCCTPLHRKRAKGLPIEPRFPVQVTDMLSVLPPDPHTLI